MSATRRTAPKPILTAVTDRPVNDRQKGIDRVLDLLEGLLRLRAPARPGDLARLIGAPRSTTYEIINRLVEAEVLEHVDDRGSVYFGRAMHLFGTAYAESNTLYRRAITALQQLAVRSNATAQLCALRGRKYVMLDSRSGSALFRIASDIGAEVPIPWTASGRLLLGHLTPAAIRAFVPEEDYRLSDGRLLDVQEFIDDVGRCTAQGWCETTGLADHFTRCLAAPIHDGPRGCTMTLCLVVPHDTPLARREALVSMLREAAMGLSEQR